MFSYRCQSCGASAYSAANAFMVGVCPSCAEPLAVRRACGAMPATSGDHSPAVDRIGRNDDV